jgi:hypothetical protein
MRAILRAMAVVACLAVCLFEAPVVRADVTQPITLWCNQVLTGDAADPPGVVRYKKAEDSICHGRYEQARATFASIVPYWVKNQNNGRWWLDTARGYFYSLIASGDDARARNFLTSVETGDQPKWQAAKGDHLFWAGDVRAAFAAYAADGDAEAAKLPDNGPNKVFDDAAQAGGDMSAAIAILRGPSQASGPSGAGSLQLLMLADAYETQRRWPDAFATWVRAADNGHAVPEYDFFDQWNLSALEMIYYYRAHIPSDQRGL